MTKVLQDFYLCEVLPAYHYPEQAEQNLALKFHAIIQKFEDLYNLDDDEKVNVANKATDTYSFKCDKPVSSDAIFRRQRTE